VARLIGTSFERRTANKITRLVDLLKELKACAKRAWRSIARSTRWGFAGRRVMRIRSAMSSRSRSGAGAAIPCAREADAERLVHTAAAGGDCIRGGVMPLCRRFGRATAC